MQANRLDALTVAREILRGGGPAALATLLADGGPFASHVLAGPGPDGSPILLLSDLAVHTVNLRRDPRASLLFVRASAVGGTAAAAERLTLVGEGAEHPDQPSAAAAYLRHDPGAARYSGFADFRFYRFDVQSAHVVAGFGLIAGFSKIELFG